MELNQRGEISCQLGAWFPELFCNFNSVKNHKIVKKNKKKSTTTKAREKKHRFGILRMFENF